MDRLEQECTFHAAPQSAPECHTVDYDPAVAWRCLVFCRTPNDKRMKNGIAIAREPSDFASMSFPSECIDMLAISGFVLPNQSH